MSGWVGASVDMRGESDSVCVRVYVRCARNRERRGFVLVDPLRCGRVGSC